MATPQMRALEIRSIGNVQTTSGGNSYLECQTDAGCVAFWGDAAHMNNIHTVEALHLPANIRCGCIRSNWSQHQFWVPQSARVVVAEPKTV